MSGNRDAVQLRAELSRYREQKRYGKYPIELRERAVSYARERSRTGATASEIATELGVYETTATMWASGGKRSIKSRSPSIPKEVGTLPLVPVLVRAEHRDVPLIRLKLEFPDGTRMQV